MNIPAGRRSERSSSRTAASESARTEAARWPSSCGPAEVQLRAEDGSLKVVRAGTEVRIGERVSLGGGFGDRAWVDILVGEALRDRCVSSSTQGYFVAAPGMEAYGA